MRNRRKSNGPNRTSSILIAIGICFIIGILLVTYLPVKIPEHVEGHHDKERYRSELNNEKTESSTLLTETTRFTEPLITNKTDYETRRIPKFEKMVESTESTIFTTDTSTETTTKTNTTAYSTIVTDTTDLYENGSTTLYNSNDTDNTSVSAFETYTTTTLKNTTDRMSTTDDTTEKNDHMLFLPYHNVSDYCNTTTCLSLSSRMLSYMNMSADPCLEPYEFVCGNYKGSKSIVVDKIDELLLDAIVKEKDESITKTFFMSCKNYLGTRNEDEIKNSANEIFKTMNKFIDTSHVTDILVYIMRNNFNPFFDIGIEYSEEDGHFITRFQGSSTGVSASQIDHTYCSENIASLSEKYQNDNLKEVYDKCMRNEGFDKRSNVIEQAFLYFNQTFDAPFLRDFRRELKKWRRMDEFNSEQSERLFMKSDNPFHDEKDIEKLIMLSYDYSGNDTHAFFAPNLEFSSEMQFLYESWQTEKEKSKKIFKMALTEWVFSKFVRPVYSTTTNKYCLDLTKELLPVYSTSLMINSSSLLEIQKNLQEVGNYEEFNKDIIIINSFISLWMNYSLFEEDLEKFTENGTLVKKEDFAGNVFRLGKQLRQMAYSLYNTSVENPVAELFELSCIFNEDLVRTHYNKYIPLMKKLLVIEDFSSDNHPKIKSVIENELRRLKIKLPKVNSKRRRASDCESPGNSLDVLVDGQTMNLKLENTNHGKYFQKRFSMDIQALKSSVRSYKKFLDSTELSRNYAWLGHEGISAESLFVLSNFQERCGSSSIKNILSKKILPNKIWVNHMALYQDEYIERFHCEPLKMVNAACPLNISKPMEASTFNFNN